MPWFITAFLPVHPVVSFEIPERIDFLAMPSPVEMLILELEELAAGNIKDEDENTQMAIVKSLAKK